VSIACDKVLSSRFAVAPETTFKGVFDDSGIVEGFTQTCRARGCKHREATKTDERKFCPEHEVLLWPVPRVRRLRFHDLRRTCASLLQMAGAPTLAASQLLRLGSTETTERVYTSLDPAWLREQPRSAPGLQRAMRSNGWSGGVDTGQQQALDTRGCRTTDKMIKRGGCQWPDAP